MKAKLERNNEIARLYYEEDLSLSKVSKIIHEKFGEKLSRQFVHVVAKRYEGLYNGKDTKHTRTRIKVDKEFTKLRFKTTKAILEV